MSMNAGDIVFYIKGDDNDLQAVLRNVDRSFSQTGRNIGLAMGAAGAAITGVLGLSANAAIEWESAFTGVRKTVDATEEQFAELEKGIIDLSMEIPVAATELAKLAEIGGQMGVPQANLLEFTKTMAILGETTNLAGEEGAAMLAQFANVAEVPKDEYSNLAATIVELGNAGTSTEGEILAMGMRIAGAGSIAGMSAGDILGFSNALVGVGIEAQAGGTAMSKLIIGIADLVAQGGSGVKKFADVAGMSSQEFIKAFKDDPAEAITMFIQGLARIEQQGGNLFGVISELGIKETIMRDVMLRATQAADDMAASVRLGNTAFAENNAHLTEAEKRFATAESRINMFKNSVFALQESIGESLRESLANRADQFREWAESLLAITRANPLVVAELVQFASILGVVLMVAGAVVAALPGITIAIGAITWPAMAASVAIAALLGVLAAAAYAVFEWARAWLAVPENMALVNAGIAAAGEWLAGIWNGIVSVFSVAVNWIGGLLDQFVGWSKANWGQIMNIFGLAKDNLLLIGGMLWEGLQLYFNQLWNFLSRVFEEIGQAFKNWAGFSADQTVTFLDVVEALLMKSKAFLEDLSVVFNTFTDFIYWLWPVLQEVMEVGVELFIQPLAYLVDYVAWAVAKITSLMSGIAGFFGGGGFAGGINIGGPQGLATGGVVTGSGWAMVGERGPELVRLPRGTTVYDHQQTAASGAMGGGGSNITLNFHVNGITNPSDFSRMAAQQLRLELGGRGL